MTSIKNMLVGTWRLLSYIEITVDGVDSAFPFGNNASGFLIYAADGYMSVMVSGNRNAPEEALDSSGKLAERNEKPEDSPCTAENFLAFSGTYRIDNRQAIAVHHVIKSFSSHLEGREIESRIDTDGDILYLKSPQSVFSNGKMVNSYMTWQRMDSRDYVSDPDPLDISVIKKRRTFSAW